MFFEVVICLEVKLCFTFLPDLWKLLMMLCLLHCVQMLQKTQIGNIHLPPSIVLLFLCTGTLSQS